MSAQAARTPQREAASPLSVGLYYGSTNGDTARISHLIQSLCESPAPWATVELFDVADFYLEDMADFDLILIGAPTWNTGQMQRDWQAVFDEFDTLDLTGKPAALFGLGDQAGYPDTFVDALAFFADKLQERGAILVGSWPTDGYDFGSSWAVREDRFVGLVLDEINQPELSRDRVERWLAQLRDEVAALAPD